MVYRNLLGASITLPSSLTLEISKVKFGNDLAYTYISELS